MCVSTTLYDHRQPLRQDYNRICSACIQIGLRRSRHRTKHLAPGHVSAARLHEFLILGPTGLCIRMQTTSTAHVLLLVFNQRVQESCQSAAIVPTTCTALLADGCAHPALVVLPPLQASCSSQQNICLPQTLATEAVKARMFGAQ
jgi:hypothetical protein